MYVYSSFYSVRLDGNIESDREFGWDTRENQILVSGKCHGIQQSAHARTVHSCCCLPWFTLIVMGLRFHTGTRGKVDTHNTPSSSKVMFWGLPILFHYFSFGLYRATEWLIDRLKQWYRLLWWMQTQRICMCRCFSNVPLNLDNVPSHQKIAPQGKS